MPVTETSTTTESPCNGTCKLDTTGDYCLGCFRSRSDIGAWSLATDREKAAINQNAKARARQISLVLQART